MSLHAGNIVPYPLYREHFQRPDADPVHWPWQFIVEKLTQSGHNERGSLTLSVDGSASRCEILPGLSVNIQIVKPAEVTHPHQHAWWHLFFVQQGEGRAALGNPATITRVRRGDLLLVPAWCPHAFENLSCSEDLAFMVLGNLPQQVALSNFRAEEVPPGGQSSKPFAAVTIPEERHVV